MSIFDNARRESNERNADYSSPEALEQAIRDLDTIPDDGSRTEAAIGLHEGLREYLLEQTGEDVKLPGLLSECVELLRRREAAS